MKFDLLCIHCGRSHPPLTVRCEEGCTSLLRTRYEAKSFEPNGEAGLFRFLDWLPCESGIESGVGPIVFRADRVGNWLGLDNLYCAFNGYWPERGAANPTGTFKDLEALPTLLGLRDRGKARIILASAGNTARAFAHAARVLDFTVYIVVPETMLHRLWLPEDGASRGNVRLAAVRGSSDYSQAIRIADELAKRYELDSEGGAKNVARRDGMGTVMLEAARVLGRLPDHYFQAVGSGTGGIAAYEASLRLLGDDRFAGQALPRLHLSQNAPFLPIYQAWKGETWTPGPDEDLFASVLANRTPPYAIRGGVADALKASAGDVYSVASDDAIAAGRELSEIEGIDLEPAAAVAVASLRQAVAEGKVRRDDLILLNLTGGGLERLRRDFDCRAMEPDLWIDESSLDSFESIL
ncbi:MAG: cysteate synthase [Acidobacteriota bacterium]